MSRCLFISMILLCTSKIHSQNVDKRMGIYMILLRTSFTKLLTSQESH